MEKEIFEQPESVVNTMRGRVNFETGKGEFIIKPSPLPTPSNTATLCKYCSSEEDFEGLQFQTFPNRTVAFNFGVVALMSKRETTSVVFMN